MAQSKTELEAESVSTDTMPSRKRHMEPQQDKQAQPTPTKTQPRTQTTQAAQAVPVGKRAKTVSVRRQVRTDHKRKREHESDKGLAPTETRTNTNARTVPAPQRNTLTEGWPTTQDEQRADSPARPQEETQATATAAQETNAAPAKLPGRKAAKEMFQYACPVCEASVSSSVRTGRIDHRRACGHRFRVKDGDVAARKCNYVCPFCKGTLRAS